MGKRKFSFKLRTKLYFISVGMVILFSAAVLVQFEKGVSDQKQGKIDGFSLYFENLSQTVSQLYYAKYNNIQAFARNKDLKDLKNVDAANFILNELITLFPDTDYFALIDLNGKVVTTNTVDSTGKAIKHEVIQNHNFAKDEWYQKTKNGEYTEDLKKRIFGAYVGQPMIDSLATGAYGKERMGQIFATRIEDEYGDPIAVLVSFVNMRWVETEMAGLYKSLEKNGMKSANIALVDNKGRPVSYYGEYEGAKPGIVKDYKNFNLKKSFFDNKGLVAKELKEKKFNTIIESGLVNKDDNLYSFGPIKNRRFLESMGWSLIVGMSPDDAFSEIFALQKMFYTTLGAVFLACLLISTLIVSKLYKQLTSVIAGLRSSAGRTFNFVSQLNEMSGKVNEMSASQASAIQETASTLDEVSQMVKMSAQNANSSVEISAKSEKNANNGKDIVNDVVKAMNQIKDSNEDVLTTTAEGNKKINEIVTVINEISEKAKVINDIVFQTKLLSFNASVEAARAGEHGKGFAVVAEEVGNLAQMSGKAAEEIGEILGESISRVENIVTENQGAIEKIMVQSKDRIEKGIEITGQCTKALEDIVEGVKVVSNMSHEISTATSEQESGVSNISEAMNQLQDNTNENSNIAYQTLKCSEQLDKETEYLKDVINTLETEIVGTKVDESQAVKRKDDDNHKDDDHNNVVSIESKKVEKVEEPVSTPATTEYQSAVGAEIPGSDDPRFEDV